AVCSADTTRRRYAAVQLPCSARQLMGRHSVTAVQIAPQSERRNSLRDFLKSGWLRPAWAVRISFSAGLNACSKLTENQIAWRIEANSSIGLGNWISLLLTSLKEHLIDSAMVLRPIPSAN
ncbi:hypothetical protein, partial [Streptomyces sp. NPDC003635]